MQIDTFPCVDKVISLNLHNEVINGGITAEMVESVVELRRNKLFLMWRNIQCWLYSK